MHVASSEHYSTRLSQKQAIHTDPRQEEGTLWGSNCKYAILIKISKTEDLVSFDVGT